MKTNQDKTRRLSVLSWALYGLAAVLLIASILLGMSVSVASTAVPAATIGFQSPILKPVWDAVVSGLQFMGVLVFVGGFILSVLVFSIGLLLGHIVRLDRRIGALEDALASSEYVTSLLNRLQNVALAPVEPHSAA